MDGWMDDMITVPGPGDEERRKEVHKGSYSVLVSRRGGGGGACFL